MQFALSATPRVPAATRCSRAGSRRVAVAFRPTRMTHKEQGCRRVECVAQPSASEPTPDPQEKEESQTASDTSGSESAEAVSSMEQSPIERARLALDAETLDRKALEAALADMESEMAGLQESVAIAESRATALDAAAATAKDQLLRLNADFENFRRRTREEKEQLAVSVRGDVVTSLLPVIDNFELARTQVKAETEGEQKINDSYQNLYKQFVEFMRGVGVEAVPSVGSPFDPNYHEAIMKEENSELPDNTVLQEFRKGFKLGDKLLRPAMVKVSVNDFPPAASQEE